MPHKHPVYDTDKHFKIDPVTKRITTECPKMSFPQRSHKSELITFEIPKEVEGHDMSLCNVVEIHYQNIEAANKDNKNIGIYSVADLKAEGETVFFSWLIEEDSTYYAGGLMFAIHFACVDGGKVEYNFPTLSYSAITIGATVWNSETIAKEHPDIIAEFESRIKALEQDSGSGLPEVTEDENGKFLQAMGGKWVAADVTSQMTNLVNEIINQKFIPISQADYDALVSAGTVDESKYYMIEGGNE